MNNTTSKIIGTLNAMQTLIENFPMWLFNFKANKVSMIDFIIDVLHQIGVNELELIDRIVTLFFNVQNASINFTNNIDLKFDNIQSDFLKNLENETKSIVLNILSAMLSCSVIPKIPEYYFDNENGVPRNVPISMIDTSNILNICPTTDIGKFYYDVDNTLTPNTLYKSQDLNAMLWYALNRGTFINQTERNKLMWDSRFSEKQYDDYNRDNAEKWNQWLNSKTEENGIFSVSGKEQEYEEALQSGTTINEPLHPIVQFYPNLYGNDASITYLISEQTFSGKTIYDFNSDYLENIQIFNPKNIVSEMINNLLNNNLKNLLNIDLGLEQKITEEKIEKLIADLIEVDDAVISDCFFSFSNDDFNAMLEEMERQRYNGKELNSETSPSIEIDKDFGINLLNNINSAATINERLETITRSVYEIAHIPENDQSVNTSDNNAVGYNTKWLNDVIMAIIKPIVKSIFSPKVMFLFIVNFDIMGMIKIDDIKTYNDIMKLFYRKMMGAILSIIKYIKDKIIVFLLKLFKEKIEPLLDRIKILLAEERLEQWKQLLIEAAQCVGTLPYINFSWRKQFTQIDDVRYADITQEQITPELTKEC